MRSIHRCRQKRRAMRQAQAAEVKVEPEKDNTTKTEPVKTDAVKTEPTKAEPEQQAITRDVKAEPVQHNPLYHFRGIQPTSRSIRDNPLLRINF